MIQVIYNDAKKRGIKVQCCALTGCAALLLELNAKTIHSWSGVGILKKTDNEIIRDIQSNKTKRNRWTSVDLLIIDEISMMNARLLSLLNRIGQKIRKSNKPFGGIQIILSGDFYQLPPITGLFCFESPDWSFCIETIIVLKQVFRQKSNTLTKILSQIRKGKISKKTYSILMNRVLISDSLRQNKNGNNMLQTNIKPTIILPIKKQSDEINKSTLDLLPSKLEIFHSKITCDIDKNTVEYKFVDYEIKQAQQSGLFEPTLYLKEGAQVMCIINLDLENGICNGSLGKIIEIFSDQSVLVLFSNNITKIIYPHIWKSDNIPSLRIEQLPLILAWSCTIHKIQGATLDYIDVDVGSGVFEDGQTYVALSRVKTLDGLFLRSFDPFKITTNRKVERFYKQIL